MDWQNLLVAFSLYLIFEGMIPFLNPEGFKHLMHKMLSLSNQSLRNFGLISMTFGLILLYVVR